jgi:ABC-type transport system involved in multi-copper enzyme maturation permease subunit
MTGAATFALLTRSWRLEARSLWTYLVRVGLLVVVLFQLLTIHLDTGSEAPGRSFFLWMMYANLVFISLAALAFFSSAISEEREEMTLGLLRMTGLTPLSILFGKSTSRVLTGLALLLTQFPFTLLAVTLGGVSARQVAAAYCMLVAYTVFVGNFALFFSVLCSRTLHASSLTGFFLIGYFVLGGYYPEFSMWARLGEILQLNYSGPFLGIQFWTHLGLAAAFFLPSWLLFDLLTRRQAAAGPSRGLVFRRTSLLGRLGCGRAWSLPVLWKDYYFTGGGYAAAPVQILLVLLPLIIYVSVEKEIPGLDVAGTFLFVTGLVVFCLGVPIAAGRIFQQEVIWQTLPGIATAPIGIGRLIAEKLASALLVMAPTGAMAALGGLLTIEHWGEELLRTTFVAGLLAGAAGLFSFTSLVVLMALLLKRGAFVLSLFT